MAHCGPASVGTVVADGRNRIIDYPGEDEFDGERLLRNRDSSLAGMSLGISIWEFL